MLRLYPARMIFTVGLVYWHNGHHYTPMVLPQRTNRNVRCGSHNVAPLERMEVAMTDAHANILAVKGIHTTRDTHT